MEIEGEFKFSAAKQYVWDRLMSADSLRVAIPGCTELSEAQAGVYKVTIKVSLAAITGTYTGTVSLDNVNPIESFRLNVDGAGKAGRVQAFADMRLRDEEYGTAVAYKADIRPQGALARLGNRLISSAANLMIGQFFKSMAEQIQHNP